jgi:hypothetical protein
MDIKAQLMMNTAPAPRITVETCTQAMYDALLALGAEIDMLEKDLDPVLHAVHYEDQQTPPPLGVVQGQQPEAIEKLGGLKASIDSYKIRLESIRLRAVVA